MRKIGLLTLFLISLLYSCTETTTIGAEILDQDQALSNSVDTFTIQATTVIEDSLRVYSPNFLINSYPIGTYEDPIFGEVSSTFFGQFKINENSVPNFSEEAVYDSLVLQLVLSENSIYGDTTTIQNFDIYRITDQNIYPDTNYYAFNSLETDPSPVGNITFSIDDVRRDSIFGASTTVSPPYIGIPLSDDLGQELFNYTEDQVEDNESFLANFKGLSIKETASNATGLYNYNVTSSYSGIFLYYHLEGDTSNTSYRYQYIITNSANGPSLRFTQFEHDFPSDIEDAIEDGYVEGEEQLYIQGLNGPYIKVNFPYLSDFEDNVAINSARLSFTVATDIDDDLFALPQQLIVLYKNEAGNLTIVDDVLFTFNGLGPSVFGGQVVEEVASNGQMVKKYEVNLAGHFQKMLDKNDPLPSEIYIKIFQETQKANRAIFYGPQHSEHPMTFTVNYTSLN